MFVQVRVPDGYASDKCNDCMRALKRLKGGNMAGSKGLLSSFAPVKVYASHISRCFFLFSFPNIFVFCALSFFFSTLIFLLHV